MKNKQLFAHIKDKKKVKTLDFYIKN